MKKFNKSKITYKKAGVNTKKADKIIKIAQNNIEKTYNKAVLPNPGGFSSLLDINKLGYKDPLVMSTTDGVGTKLQLAIKEKNFTGIGIDLVAMCVNDIVAQGGLPYFFMDYIATGKLKKKYINEVLNSIVEGCKIAECALVGGETAEMPGHYENDNFDLAGFCIGLAERKEYFKKNNVKNKDIVIGVKSSGLHSNGFSLIRYLINKNLINIDKISEFDKEKKLKDILLEPTKIYSPMLKYLRNKVKINAISHITGGGLIDNPIRNLSEELYLDLDMKSYEIPPLFYWIKQISGMSWMDMFKTFNCGVGLLIFTNEKNLEIILKKNKEIGYESWLFGRIRKKEKSDNENVNFLNMDYINVRKG